MRSRVRGRTPYLNSPPAAAAPTPKSPPPRVTGGVGDPTADDWADLIVVKLERYVRDGRTVNGVPYRDWQAMARTELLEAFREMSERQERYRQDVLIRRLLAIVTAALITIGFWGSVMAVDHDFHFLAAFIILIAGIVLVFFVGDFSVRGLWAGLAPRRRDKLFRRIDSYDRQLQRIEAELEKRLKDKRKELDEKAAEA